MKYNISFLGNSTKVHIMVLLDKISPLGFGGYRISVRSKEHYEALFLALKKGLNLIDTSANYTDGESETLVGQVLADHPELPAFVVTKAGYIQGKNMEVLEELQKQGKALEGVVDFGADLKHSIHPEFLENQMGLSLQRLKRPYLDGFLLHNPEYFLDFCFKDGIDEVSRIREEYYQRIKTAFTFLEEKVAQGVIKYYGVSSNNFPYSGDDPRNTDLKRILDMAKEVSSNHHMRLIQFPLNWLETGAIDNTKNSPNLIQLAKEKGIKTLINRPLNAFGADGLLRLSTYDQYRDNLRTIDEEQVLKVCSDFMQEKWEEQMPGEDLWSTPFLQQFLEFWKSLPSPDAVDQVYFSHFFPFLAQLWDGHGVPKDVAVHFYELYEISICHSYLNMGQRAADFRREMVEKGEIREDDKRPLPLIACSRYLEWGVDHVLVGMRKKEYVEQLSPLF